MCITGTTCKNISQHYRNQCFWRSDRWLVRVATTLHAVLAETARSMTLMPSTTDQVLLDRGVQPQVDFRLSVSEAAETMRSIALSGI